MTRQEIKEKFLQAFKASKSTINDEEIELSLNYHFNENYDSKKLIKYYNENLEKYQHEYSNDIKKIKKLISFVSLSRTPLDDILEELPFFKTIKVFNNIDTLYLLYTEESKRKYEEILTFFFLNNPKIKLYGEQVDSENITATHKYLKSLVITKKINKEDTLIDSTLGLKMTGIAMYKLTVEYGIKSLTWRDFQMPVYDKEGDKYKLNDNKNGKRVPLLVELKFLKEPTNENIKIYQAINKEISNFNFSVVADYYNNMGMEDSSFFFKKLSEVINLNTILEFNCNNFYDNISTFLNDIFKYKFNEEILVDKIRSILIKLSILVNYDYTENEKKQFNITTEELEEEREELKRLKLDKDNVKTKLYHSLILKYLFANSELNTINQNISDLIFNMIFEQKNIEKNLDIDQYFSILFNSKDYDEIIDYLDFSEILKNEQTSLVYLKGFTLYIDKFDIKIDLQKELSNIYFSNGKIYNSAIPLIKLLEDEGNTEGFRFIEEMKDTWSEKKFEQTKSALKRKVILPLNNLIKEKLKEKMLKEYDFILEIKDSIGTNTKQDTFTKIKINPEFLDYRSV